MNYFANTSSRIFENTSIRSSHFAKEKTILNFGDLTRRSYTRAMRGTVLEGSGLIPTTWGDLNVRPDLDTRAVFFSLAFRRISQMYQYELIIYSTKINLRNSCLQLRIPSFQIPDVDQQ